MSQTSFINAFAGWYKATSYAFGCANGGPAALSVHSAPIAASTTALTVAFGYSALLGSGDQFYPLSTNAPVSVGADSNVEIVTPSAVSANTPAYGGMNFTATFANAHGEGDPISSASFGLQEAINAANAAGGGVVVIDAAWTALGGTNTILAAAVWPSNVTLLDNRAGAGGAPFNTTITIANAQVLTNNSVPTPVLPAMGSGTMWDVVDMVVENKNTGVAYASGGAMALYYGTSSAGVLATATIAATFLTSPTAAHVIKVAGALADTAGSSILNKGLVFANPSADFTTGTGTVILKVSARLLTGL